MEMTARSQRFCCPYLSKNLQGKDKWRTKAWLASPVMPKHPRGLTPAAWLQTGLQACGAPSQQLRLPAGAPGLCHAREMPRAGRRAQHPCAFLTVSISVASVWVAPVTVHMFAGCRCAEGYLHTRWCCKSRGFSRPSPVPVPAVLAMPMGTTADLGGRGLSHTPEILVTHFSPSFQLLFHHDHFQIFPILNFQSPSSQHLWSFLKRYIIQNNKIELNKAGRETHVTPLTFMYANALQNPYESLCCLEFI